MSYILRRRFLYKNSFILTLWASGNVQLLCWHCCYFCQIGELIGGSQREERIEYLENRLDELKLNKDSFWWYLDLRRYGTGKYLYLFPMFKSFSSSLLLTLPLERHFPPVWFFITTPQSGGNIRFLCSILHMKYNYHHLYAFFVSFNSKHNKSFFG